MGYALLEASDRLGVERFRRGPVKGLNMLTQLEILVLEGPLLLLQSVDLRVIEKALKFLDESGLVPFQQGRAFLYLSQQQTRK